MKNGRRLLAAGMTAALLVALVAGTVSANLAGSLFEGNDGNVIVNTAGNIDWSPTSGVPGFHGDQDLATGQADNSFGGGTKENDVNVNVVDGSIPNSKADLGRFAVGSETRPNNHVYLYLAWVRENQSGTTNFDFEVNQAEQPDLTTQGAKVLNRTVNDLLITYDFQGGSQTPTIGARRWNGNSWAVVNLGAQSTEADVNDAATVTENLSGDGNVERATFQFGEAAIDLTAAGLLPGGGNGSSCAGFSSVFVKSRSSDAFTSALKDFIAPIPVDLNTCGAIEITKTRKHAADGTGDHAHAGVEFTLNGTSIGTTDADGKLCVSGLNQSATPYTVAEVVPDGYVSDDDSKEVTVNNVASCDANFETVTFSNTPLTDVTVTVDSQVDGGTASTIECDQSSDDPDAETDADGDGSFVMADLEPMTLVCTIVIDP